MNALPFSPGRRVGCRPVWPRGGMRLAAPVLLGAGLLPAAGQGLDQIDDFPWSVRGGVKFLSGAQASLAPTPAPVVPEGGYLYDNGFVYQDDGKSSDFTWNWGYQSADQVNLNEDQLGFERYDNLPRAGRYGDESGDSSIGFEVIGGIEFIEFEVGRRPARFGAEVGYAWTPFAVDFRSTAASTASYTTASHALNGITPPLPPYAGNPSGPGPLVGLNPTSATVASAASGDYRSTFDSDLHHLKVGLWFEYFPLDRLSLAVSFGYASVYAGAELQFTETIAFANPAVPALADRATVRDTNWHSGVYASLRATYYPWKHLGAYVAADYQWNDVVEFSGRGQQVALDLSALFSVSLGVIYDF